MTSASEAVVFTSSSQIASSLSAMGSIGSIIIGLLLIRYNRTKQKEDPSSAVSGQSGQSHLTQLHLTRAPTPPR